MHLKTLKTKLIKHKANKRIDKVCADGNETTYTPHTKLSPLYHKCSNAEGFWLETIQELKLIYWKKLHMLVRLRKFLLRSSISVQTLALDLTICESDKRKHNF